MIWSFCWASITNIVRISLSLKLSTSPSSQTVKSGLTSYTSSAIKPNCVSSGYVLYSKVQGFNSINYS